MSRIFPRKEEEDMKKDFKPIKKDGNVISFLTDFCFGFFFYPFLSFILKTTVKIVKSPATINEASMLLFIALVTGVYYLLRKETIVVIETKISNIFFMTLGLAFFIFLLNTDCVFSLVN